jgi:hypothetical protein
LFLSARRRAKLRPFIPPFCPVGDEQQNLAEPAELAGGWCGYVTRFHLSRRDSFVWLERCR